MTYHYLAGPMRGIPEFNFPAFRDATKQLRKAKYTIFSPHEQDERDGYNWDGSTGSQEDLDAQDFNIAISLLRDIEIIAAPLCVGVIALPEWYKSRGATAEVSFALALGKVVYELETPCRSNGYQYELAPVLGLGLSTRYNYDGTVTL